MEKNTFASVVDDIFKDCKTKEELLNHYRQLSRILDTLLYKNVSLFKEGEE